MSTLSIAADAQITSITPLISIEKDKQPTTVAAGTVDNAGEGFNFLDSPATYRPSSHSFRIANCILLALLLWQIMHGYRSEVAIVSPAWRTLLENYCVVVQCDIALPRQLSLLSLESSELKFSSTDTTDEISLTATIRNHAPFPQELPALLLSLTDVNDRVVASQILHPQDYLAPEALDTVTTGFLAHHEILIQRRFRLEAIKAMGYRLELHY